MTIEHEKLRAKRQEVIDHLSEAFAGDEIELAEFERRLATAHRAAEPNLLDPLVADLKPVKRELGPTTAASTELATTMTQRHLPAVIAKPMLTTVLGSTARRGAWSPPREMKVRAILGSVELDFRDANMQPGVTEIELSAFFGSVEITVPPHLAVQVEGNAILGSFEHVERAPLDLDEGAPLLRIKGFACLGSVEVTTKLKKSAKRLKP